MEEDEPCFFADYKLSKNKQTVEWTVGVYNDKSSENHTVKIKKSSPIWNMANQPDFGGLLITAFKEGGKKSVDEKVSNLAVAN